MNLATCPLISMERTCFSRSSAAAMKKELSSLHQIEHTRTGRRFSKMAQHLLPLSWTGFCTMPTHSLSNERTSPALNSLKNSTAALKETFGAVEIISQSASILKSPVFYIIKPLLTIPRLLNFFISPGKIPRWK